MAEIATAKIRILMMGSLKFSRYCFQAGSRGGGVMTLAPYFSRLACTCGVESPDSPPANSRISSRESMVLVSLRQGQKPCLVRKKVLAFGEY